jgi:chaperonin GroEL
MKIKRILKGAEARLKAKEGIDLVADIVKITLGPKGRNNLIKDYGPVPPIIINDGVSIAEKIQSEDCFVNAGVELANKICRKTNDIAGDGTTTTALLAQAIISEGQKRLLAGENPIDIKNEIEQDGEFIIESLKKISKPAEDKETIRNIATIASNNDTEVGDKISEIIEVVGKNASILVEKSNDSKLKIETVKGIYFDKGWRVPAFVNQPQHMKAVLEDALICVTDKKLHWVDDFEEFFKKIIENKLDKIVLIADEIEGDALATLAMTNKSILMGQNGLHILAIEAPEFGQTKEEILEDICVMTGAQLISDKTGYSFIGAQPLEVLGACEKVVSDSKATTLVGCKGDIKAVEERISGLKAHIAQLDPTEKITREKLEKRLSIMESGVGIIYAGGSTDVEAKDRNLRLEDAILATRSAIKSGYVIGGGFTYLKLSEIAKTKILQEALKQPLLQVAKNAGKSSDNILEKVKENGLGWNAKTDEYGDLEKMGVIDATLVVESAIKNAVSLASMFLTMENMIVEDIDDKKEEKK